MENSEQEQEEQQRNIINKDNNLPQELQEEVEVTDLKDINIDVENESGVDSINVSQETQPIEDPLDITDNFNSSNVQEEHENGDHFMSQAEPFVNSIDLKPEIIGNVVNNINLETIPLPNGITLPFSFPGQSFSEQSQKLILNVWDFFKRARKDPKLIHSLKGPQDHASAALNVGTKTIGKIAKRVLRLGKLETPGKKRNRPKTVLDSVDEEGEKVLRTIIRELYDRKTAPTISLVLAEAKERINFKGSTTSLRRILKRMGFKYGGLNNTMIQSEKSNVSGWKEKSMKKNWKSKTCTTNSATDNNTTSTPTKRKNEGKKTRTNNNSNSNGNSNPKKQSRKKIAQTMEQQQQQLLHQPIEISAHEVIEAHEIIESHELLQPHEVIIHYQKQSESGETHSFLTQSGSTQMITVTDPREILQLQLNSNGQTQTVPVQVVHEWNYEC